MRGGDFPEMKRHRRNVSRVIVERALTTPQNRNGTFKST